MYEDKVILLVDDSPTMRKIISGSLKKMGNFQIIEAGNGVEAIELLEKQKVDLIISDWLMPEMDGLEFVRTVRRNKNYGEVPILMLTINNYRNDVLAAMNSGVNGYLVKPYREEEFHRKVESILKYAG